MFAILQMASHAIEVPVNMEFAFQTNNWAQHVKLMLIVQLDYGVVTKNVNQQSLQEVPVHHPRLIFTLSLNADLLQLV